MEVGRGSEPMAGVIAVAARRAPVAMGLIGVLIGVLVVLVGVRMLAAVLRARRHAVASLVRPLVVEILLRRHQVAPLVGSGMVARVVALPHSLALLGGRVHGNGGGTDRERPQARKTMRRYC